MHARHSSYARIAFVVNALTGKELKGGKRDNLRIYDLLIKHEFGDCDLDKSKQIFDCDNSTLFHNELVERLKSFEKNDQLIFYFSGHGQVVSNRFFLMLGKESEDHYSYERLIDEITFHKIRSAIIILDACHSGAVNRSVGRKGQAKDSASKRIPLPDKIPRGFAILASSLESEQSFEFDDRSYSIFTHLICECIETGFGRVPTADNIITIENVQQYVLDKLDSPAFEKYPQEPNFRISSLGGPPLWIARNITKPREPHRTKKDIAEHIIEDHLLNRPTRVTEFDNEEVAAYRKRLRPEIRKKHLNKTNQQFLKEMGYLENGYLTLLGIYLFGTERIRKTRISETLCSVYDDLTETASEKGDYDGPIHHQIEETYEFVMSHIGKKEMVAADKANLDIVYQYSGKCVRELIANALCHRDYTETGMNVHVCIFRDRIKISNPGNWYGKEIQDNKIYSLDELKTESGSSRQRNPSLAKAMHNILLSEKRGEGIKRAIEDCEVNRCAIPTVVQRDGVVTVTIYPREDWSREIKGTRVKEPTLRKLVNSEKLCAKKFEEAEALALSIFGESEGKKLPLPYFVEHAKEHCEAIEEYLNKIIWESEVSSDYDFIPTPEEAMYLLSSVWLHDIGMWYGIFDGEHPGDLDDTRRLIELRDSHEIRTAKYIHDSWKDNCSWSNEEKSLLSNICFYHCRRHPMSAFSPFAIEGMSGRVRPVVLAALLRLADTCNEARSLVPEPLRILYISLGVPQEVLGEWRRATFREVSFDHIGRNIVLTGHYPPKFHFDFGEFDLGEVGEIIRRDVEEELRSVQQILLPYPNTSFWEVKHEANYISALAHQGERQCLALWPYLLDKPSSSTEAAAALAQVLLLATEDGEKAGNIGVGWRRKISQIMKKIEDSRPFNFMIKNLCREVESILTNIPEEARSAHELTDYLRSFMKTTKERCAKMSEHALDIIMTRDVLVIYGYSTNVEMVLRNLEKQNGLYIVDCYNPADARIKFDENKRIMSIVHELGFAEVRFLQLHSFAQAIDELQRTKTSYKLFLGTNGILKNGDLLCKVGSYTLATIVKEHGGMVVAFAEKMKLFTNGVSDEEIADPQKLFSSKEYRSHPDMNDVKYIAAKMDRLPRLLVDIIINDEGVQET